MSAECPSIVLLLSRRLPVYTGLLAAGNKSTDRLFMFIRRLNELYTGPWPIPDLLGLALFPTSLASFPNLLGPIHDLLGPIPNLIDCILDLLAPFPTYLVLYLT